MKSTTEVKADAYSKITDAILSRLDAGVIPWRQTWHNQWDLLPHNLETGRAYTGVNQFLLQMFAAGESPFFLTPNQIKTAGGRIKKGAKGYPIVYVNRYKRVNGQLQEVTDFSGEVPTTEYKFIRYYHVFNYFDTEGLNFSLPEGGRIPEEHQRIERAEKIITGMPKPPQFEYHDNHQPAYYPLLDTVKMPPMMWFDGPEEFYNTFFHEVAHATGHPDRLNRTDYAGNMGNKSGYAEEELVAEFAAAFLSGHCGIERTVIENSAAYIAHWSKVLREDKKLVFRAISKARRAADYILGTEGKEVFR